jgi:hypothetical protein
VPVTHDASMCRFTVRRSADGFWRVWDAAKPAERQNVAPYFTDGAAQNIADALNRHPLGEA